MFSIGVCHPSLVYSATPSLYSHTLTHSSCWLLLVLRGWLLLLSTVPHTPSEATTARAHTYHHHATLIWQLANQAGRQLCSSHISSVVGKSLLPSHSFARSASQPAKAQPLEILVVHNIYVGISGSRFPGQGESRGEAPPTDRETRNRGRNRHK